MKRVFILLLMLWISSNSFAQYVIEKSPLVIRVNDSIFNKRLVYDCEPQNEVQFTINRNYEGQTVIVVFRAGTHTVWLYLKKSYDVFKESEKKSDYNPYEFGLEDPRAYYTVRNTNIKPNPFGEDPMLNLTSLEDGDYIAECPHCSCRRIVKISLITQ